MSNTFLSWVSLSRDGVAQQARPAPDAITPDIADSPSRYPTLFSRESWERYCVAKHGAQAAVLARSLFAHLEKIDGRNDGVLDIHGLALDTVIEVFGFGDVDAVFDKFEGPFKDDIRADLDALHHSAALRPHRGELFVTKIGENRFFAVSEANNQTYTITSTALNAAWDKAMQLHPDTPWMRVVTHNGYHTGRTNNPADPDHQVANIALMQADLLVTGGVGAVTSSTEMLIAPSGSLSEFIDPYTIDLAINAIVGLTYLLAAIAGKGRASSSVPPMAGGGGESPYQKPAPAYPRAVVSQLVARLRLARERGERIVTAYLGDAPKPAQQLPYVQLNANPIPDLLAKAAAALRRRPSEPSGGFAPAAVSEGTRFQEVTPPPPAPEGELPGGVEAPTAVRRGYRLSGGFTPPHLPPDTVDVTGRSAMDVTQPAKPAATARDTDRQPKSGLVGMIRRATGMFVRPTVPVTPNAALPEIISTFKNGLAQVPGAQNITVHHENGTIYVSGAANGNQVSITVPSMTTLDSARVMLKHVMPILAHRAPVPLNVKVTFEPDFAFDSLCREFNFTPKAIDRAKAGGIVKVHMEGHNVKRVEFEADDAAVLRINRITGGDLVTGNTMRIELIFPRPVVEAGSFTHEHLQVIKDQLMGAILRIDRDKFSDFAPALQPLDF